MCDVVDLGGPVADQLPEALGEWVRLSRDDLPVLPAALASDRLVLLKGVHIYDGFWRADRVELFATRQTLRALGVLVLAMLFREAESGADIRLTHKASHIRTLRLASPALGGQLAVRPLWYEYAPEDRGKHPWLRDFIDPDDPSDDLPTVFLTTHDETGGYTDQDWQDRDTVIGFGSLRGMAKMGQLLLDAGRAGNPCLEFELEGEVGFRGVGAGSGELRIWLPGSDLWGARQPPDPLD